jgi:NAD(P)-dependent dehydrogenase (short-subunit alcohol dehydrogenase family)/uncharacterized OB-fold protein
MIPPPRRKNPLVRTRQPLLPPCGRSRTALGIGAAASWGVFRLQVCAVCGAVQYPTREVCGACLSGALHWREVARGGVVMAATTVRISADPYFRERTPWRIGTVTMDAGPAVIAHLHDGVAVGERVDLLQRLDKGGNGVMIAVPEGSAADDALDGQAMREMTCDPRDRRVLVSDGRSAVGLAVAQALAAAGATVLVGFGETWRDFAPIAGIDSFPLDVTDTDSVRRAAAEFGGRIEIVVNTATHIRPGGILARGDVGSARDEMEVCYFGFMRLAQAFGPALRARGADGTHPACAWVNVLSVFGLAGDPAWGGFSAAQAASLSLSQSLRAELRPGGIRVIDLLVGPLDDEWHQALPPPKVSAEAVGAAVVRALRAGVERMAVGDVAADIVSRWRDDPDILARETMGERV